MNDVGSGAAKPIIAQDQIQLGLGRCWQLAVSGMSYRAFRSGVTTAILALAAAFLVHMLGFGLIENATQREAFRETQSRRLLGQEILRLITPDTDRVIVLELGSSNPAREREYAAWGNLTTSEMASARSTAFELGRAVDYFENLPPTPKAAIVGDRTAEELFDTLAVPSNFTAFERQIQNFALGPPSSPIQLFGVLLGKRRPELLDMVRRIRLGHQQAIARLTLATGSANQALIELPLETLGNALVENGFSIAPERLRQMRDFALGSRDRKNLEQMLVHPQVRGAVARRANVEPKDVNFDRLAEWIVSIGDARWLQSVIRDAGATAQSDPDHLCRLLAEYRRARRLSQIADSRPPSKMGALGGLSSRSQWLIVLSFLVCMVGVTNAMLMSVTERFTEIATMKCLGALDRFVMRMFVLEALTQGAAGGVAGLLLGLVLAVVRGAIEFGPLLGLASPAVPAVLLATLLSLVATMALAAVSAVGPAYVAARLSPMEAMRVE
jgi:hypothetical protein